MGLWKLVGSAWLDAHTEYQVAWTAFFASDVRPGKGNNQNLTIATLGPGNL